MKNQQHINFKAFLMLFILLLSSIGMPLITHSCSHENKKDVHLFSSEHHCEDKCNAVKIMNDVLSFNETPCCSYETSFLKNDHLLSPQSELTKKQIVILSSLLFRQDEVESFFSEKLEYKSLHHKSYGYKYRIVLQSFLC